MSLLSEKVRCQKCYERGYHSRNSISIVNICKYCGGRGYIDWVDHMTGNPSPLPFDKKVETKIIMRNIEHLMAEIKVMLLQIDIRATVKVEQYESIHNHHHNIGSISSDGNIEYRSPEYPKRTILSL